MKTEPEECSLEAWKESANQFSLEFLENNVYLFEGFTKTETPLIKRFSSLKDVILFLQENTINDIDNYFHSIEIVNVHTPENYSEEQLSIYEKEKSNFSGNYSEAFKELPTIGLYTLKYTEKKLD